MAPGQVWKGEKNLAPAGIRSPERPARSESLYRLSYSGPPSQPDPMTNRNKRTGSKSYIYKKLKKNHSFRLSTYHC
jgi:hypothetical protein